MAENGRPSGDDDLVLALAAGASVSEAAERSDPPDDDPDYLCENVVDVESELLKIKGDRDGWRARQLFLERDLAEMIQREWPDIDTEPRAGD